MFTSHFNKDRKLIQKRNKDVNKLTEVMTLLINEQPLLPKHKNHPLYGEYIGKWECHIEPDWLLIYRIDTEERCVVFYRNPFRFVLGYS